MEQPYSTTGNARSKKPRTDYIDQGKPILPKVSRLRQKLGEKAKREPNFRFYVLYDRIFRFDVLRSAWYLVLENKGGPGIDGVTIQQVLESDPFKLLEEIQEELRAKTYKPSPIKLMIGLEQRIADRSLLKLIRMWLKAPVIETDK